MQLHTLSYTGGRRRKKRIGRGGKCGTYSGRGTKGQKARSGHRIRPEIRDVIKKIPKKRGEHGGKLHSIATKPAIVNVEDLVRLLDVSIVSPKTLHEAKLIRTMSGKLPKVKILGEGVITKAIAVEGCIVSAMARAKIEKAGGKIAH